MDRDDAIRQGRRAKPDARTPWLERIASGVGLLLALAVFGLIGWEGFDGSSRPPEIGVQVKALSSIPGGYRVEFLARNTGGSAGAQVEIEGTLFVDGAEETSRVVLDYVPANSVRKGGLFFARDPRTGRLAVRARGYSSP